jgi:hypothetical protein
MSKGPGPVEQRAREICLARGVDPDGIVIGRPAARPWHYFREFAKTDLEKAAKDAKPQMTLPL